MVLKMKYIFFSSRHCVNTIIAVRNTKRSNILRKRRRFIGTEERLWRSYTKKCLEIYKCTLQYNENLEVVSKKVLN